MGRSIIFLLVFLCWASGAAYSQTKQPESESITSCEENEALLDNLSALILKDHDGGNLIVIARLGAGESSADLINHRLYNATEYMLARTRAISRDRIIIARGERTNGLGRIDFYFMGKIVGSLFTRKNRALCVDCCENRPITPYKKELWKNKL